METLLRRTLTILAEFNENYDYIPLSRGFIGYYLEQLEQGLSGNDDRTRLLAMALEVLAVVRAERAKLQDDVGGHLRVAIIEGLIGDIRVCRTGGSEEGGKPTRYRA
jgi:hypothetical protein